MDTNSFANMDGAGVAKSAVLPMVCITCGCEIKLSKQDQQRFEKASYFERQWARENAEHVECIARRQADRSWIERLRERLEKANGL